MARARRRRHHGLQDRQARVLAYNPAPNRAISEGDVLIAHADPGELAQARAVAAKG